MKQIITPVKQFKIIIGETTIKSAHFLVHGKNVIATAFVTKAVDKAARNAKRNSRKEKDGANEKEKNYMRITKKNYFKVWLNFDTCLCHIFILVL